MPPKRRSGAVQVLFRLRRQRHQVPPLRHLLDGGFGRDDQLLGQGVEDAIEECVLPLAFLSSLATNFDNRAAFENKGGPIASTSFNHTGRIFAYAVTQDWSGGHMSNKPDFPNKVYLHPCKDEVRFLSRLPPCDVC